MVSNDKRFAVSGAIFAHFKGGNAVIHGDKNIRIINIHHSRRNSIAVFKAIRNFYDEILVV